MFDIIIVGAGPSGLSAALMLGRCRRHVLVCDSGQPRNAASSAMHGFLTQDGTTPEEFRRIGREQLRPYTTVEYRPLEVVDVERQDNHFNVTLADQTRVDARALLLATGLKDILPPIEGIEQFYGKSVFQCPYCHGWEVRDQPLVVYGSGNLGLVTVLHLTPWSRDLVLCTDGPGQLERQHLKMLAVHRIKVCEDHIVRLEGVNGQLERIVFADETSLPCRAMVCSTQPRQTSLLEKLGCTLPNTPPPQFKQPIVPGVYIAGDAFYGRWITGAVASGAEVAVQLHTTLLEEDLTMEAQAVIKAISAARAQ
jgi:thioredoxin reductase